MSANQKNAETLAVAVAQTDWKETAKIKDFLRQEVERYGFTNLLLANTDGTALSGSVQTVIVSRRKHYLKALEGTPSISEVTISDFSNTYSIELAVPIRQGDVITGVLLADYSLEDFQHIVQVPIFGGRGNSVLIDDHGVVIIGSGENTPYNFNVWVLLVTMSTEQTEAKIQLFYGV